MVYGHFGRRVKHNLLLRIKEKEMVATLAFKVEAMETNGREGKSDNEREKRKGRSENRESD